ncbi:PP2C family protein-serine/threonine phosphatase [Amycolatopsis lurida]
MIRAAGGSEVGTRYRENYDVWHLAEDPLLAVVADGMGDGPGSAMAGRTAVDVFVAGAAPDPARLREAVALAQRQVGDFGRRLGGLAGCTLTGLVADGTTFWITQIGDSRVYRLRGRQLELLTTDHTMAWLGAVHGWYAFDSPEAHAARYQLTRYIGHGDEPAPDVLNVAALPGDVYLLCTDGIAEQVPFAALAEILGRGATPADQVRRLLAAAAAAGGKDNSTAIVITVD